MVALIPQALGLRLQGECFVHMPALPGPEQEEPLREVERWASVSEERFLHVLSSRKRVITLETLAPVNINYINNIHNMLF